MTAKLFVFPYNSASASAKELAKKLDIPILRRENSKFVPGQAKYIINWGNSNPSQMPPAVASSPMANTASNVAEMSNKLKFFQRITNFNSTFIDNVVNIPQYFTTYQQAKQFRNDFGGTWLARTILNGHSGSGIVILETDLDWENFEGTQCNLFVKYIKKASEYRVHFRDFSRWSINPEMRGKAFFVQRKATPVGQASGANFKIRNHQNGFVYVNEGGNVELPAACQTQIDNFLKFNAGRLDFGALDIIYNKQYNTAYVLEVNTAPGLSGLTIDKYAEQFKLLEGF